ncbi:hypothetical protein ABZ883_14820 [Streptomyces sp. NPDC046977]|uniref:hypothetical protein n=1 Tax=Streptomyces sp. NPDC046977 TaxID=3154703 RepID=UPI0033F26E68
MNLSDILTTPYVTLGAPTLGTIVLLLVHLRWWKKSGGKKTDDGGGGRSVLALLPFWLSWCYGMIAVLASPGISVLGITTRAVLWSGNGLGYAYLVWGIGGDSPTATRAAPVVLTAGGYAVFAIWTAMVIGHHLWSKRIPRQMSLFGVLSGIFMGMAAGIAGVAAVPLASAINMGGAWYTGVMQ